MSEPNRPDVRLRHADAENAVWELWNQFVSEFPDRLNRLLELYDEEADYRKSAPESQ